MEQKVYDLSQKLGATQGQVNTLFTIMQDIKDAVKEMAGDIKSIQKDIHKIVEIEDKIKEIGTLRKDVDKLREWKWTVTGGVILLSIIVPYVIEKLWH